METHELRDRNGCCVLDIVDKPGRRIKKGTFDRHVPLHPDVIALGFLDYVEQVVAIDETFLFPETRPTEKYEMDQLGTNFSKWFRVRSNRSVSRDKSSASTAFGTLLRIFCAK